MRLNEKATTMMVVSDEDHRALSADSERKFWSRFRPINPGWGNRLPEAIGISDRRLKRCAPKSASEHTQEEPLRTRAAAKVIDSRQSRLEMQTNFSEGSLRGARFLLLLLYLLLQVNPLVCFERTETDVSGESQACSRAWDGINFVKVSVPVCVFARHVCMYFSGMPHP